MNWLIWRQHRKQFLAFGVLLALFAALVIPTGIHYWNVYQHALSTCAANPATPICGNLANNLFTSSFDGLIRTSVILGTFALPLLVGAFIGSPLFAREYEEGTDKLAWTQSISRRKWLSAKLAWVLGFAGLYGTVLTLLATWWSRTPNALLHNRFVQGHFETQGLMPIAYCLLFTAVGFMVGAWFRKTLVGMAVTLGLFVLCLAGFAQWIRPHYMTPVTVTSPMGPGVADSQIPADAWVIRRDIVDGKGRIYNTFGPKDMPAACQELTLNRRVADNSHAAQVKANGGDPVSDCLTAAGWHQKTVYHPSYRYWDFQRMEAGIYLGMTALVVGATYWLVLKRDA